MKRFAMLLATVALLAGCSGQPAAEVPSEGVVVALKDLSFEPKEVTVKAGTAITFVNKDNMDHDVLQVAVKEINTATPGFTSPVLKPGESWSVTFDQAGTYPILCQQGFHYTAGMVGSITVTP